MHNRCALLLMITAKSFENDDTDVQPLPNRLSWLSEIFSDLEALEMMPSRLCEGKEGIARGSK